MKNPAEKKRDVAVALKWDGTGAPRVSAKGTGETAERILDLAAKHGIPLRHERELVDLLLLVDLNDEIPESLYIVIAEIIAFAYSLQNKPVI
jgi:flagellar biosynthesis protein